MNNRKHSFLPATFLWVSLLPFGAAAQEGTVGTFTGDINTLRMEVIEALSERERIAVDRISTASSALVAKRDQLQNSSIDEDIAKWQKDTLNFFLNQMQNASPQAGFEVAAGDAFLDVVLVRLDIDLTQEASNGKPISFSNGQTALQVARTGSPEKAIIWTTESGYIQIPSEYLSVYVPQSSNPIPLKIGGESQ